MKYKPRSFSIEKLARAYELLKSTDMNIVEVSRALNIEYILLQRAIRAAEEKGVYLK